MRILKGIAAAGGIAWGNALLFLHTVLVADKEKVMPSQVEKELGRLDTAVADALQEIEIIIKTLPAGEQLDILETHKIMLMDPQYISEIKDAVKIRNLNAAWAVESVTASLVATLEGSEDVLISERAADFTDVGQHLVAELLGKKRPSLGNLNDDVILVADSLLPSEMLSIDKKHVKAIALDTGGRTSHVAIFARSFGIPTVLGLGSATRKLQNGDKVILDGNSGLFFIRPEWRTDEEYRKREKEWVAYQRELSSIASLPSVSPDGRSYVLKANVETVDEIPGAIEKGAAGIGLFRSESLYLRTSSLPTEEEQFVAYKSVLAAMDGLPVTIRTIDIGGDKAVTGVGIDEENPILGWRAVRFCLERKDIFRVQLRALLRASAYGKLHIMFPMISGIDELDKVLFILEQVKEELRNSKVPFDENLKVGSMIEVPSAALCSDFLARKVDFFSIGTNDLIQYTIAVDRGNEKIAYLYQPFHLGVLRLIKIIIDNAHAAGIPVGMCGEMASDPLATVLLAGLGLDEFSMSPSSLLEVRRLLRNHTYAEAKELADGALKLSSASIITKYLKDWMSQH
ncbi:MAG: phosphoenolpyruvate--protein phosphotransferase [Spirochaetia bacterium]|jgi:phosphotransferase system enzyme I (PtsI)|nr:phosphoenolpyruvate--protein phosphotransferase [Spirochaetia bacterium]